MNARNSVLQVGGCSSKMSVYTNMLTCDLTWNVRPSCLKTAAALIDESMALGTFGMLQVKLGYTCLWRRTAPSHQTGPTGSVDVKKGSWQVAIRGSSLSWCSIECIYALGCTLRTGCVLRTPRHQHASMSVVLHKGRSDASWWYELSNRRLQKLHSSTCDLNFRLKQAKLVAV